MAPRPIVQLLSPALAAWEYYFRPDLRDPYGGPFNGQKARQAIFLELAQCVPFRGVIETGTFRGSTTEFLAERTTVPVWTIESRLRFYYFARMRLKKYKRVNMSIGDSRSFLRRLAADTNVPKRGVFFYLDAHWYEDLPLMDEVTIITQNWSDVVIMVDDFEVPQDSGYKFDDYGEHKRLCLDYFGPLDRFGLQAFFPRASSAEETGMQRGSVILADAAPAERLRQAQTLRRVMSDGYSSSSIQEQSADHGVR